MNDTTIATDAITKRDLAPEPETFLAAALRYATERGWAIFPAPRGEKKSHKSAKFSDGRRWGATADPNQIRRDFNRWPKANIGIPTGAVNRIFVVEADTPLGHNVDGISALTSLELQHGKLPATLMAESPTGSLHRYFNHPGDVKIVSRALVPGVDVKGDGGMVIAPPSIRSDGAYRWANNLPIADAPRWLLDLVTQEEVEERGFGDELTADSILVDAALEVIPNDDIDWDEWNKIGMAIYAATNGGGFATFDAWSQKSKKYNAKDTKNKWHAYHRSPPKRIGCGTLFFLAEQASPGWRDAYDLEIQAKLDAAAQDEALHARSWRRSATLSKANKQNRTARQSKSSSSRSRRPRPRLRPRATLPRSFNPVPNL
jgi:hypothetical protein